MSDNPFSISDSYSGEGDKEDLQRRPKSPFATAVTIGMVVSILFLLVGLLMPAVHISRPASPRVRSANNLRQIGIALLNYESTYGCLPPAYTVDAKGNRLHSWRTLILPFIEQQAIYSKIDLSKPWDSAANAKFNKVQIGVFECPRSGVPSGSSSYVVVDDPAGIFNGNNAPKLSDALDGQSKTLLVIEVDKSLSVPWMSPNDLDLQTYLDAKFETRHAGGANACLADGTCHFLPSSMEDSEMEALVTKAAGDAVELP